MLWRLQVYCSHWGASFGDSEGSRPSRDSGRGCQLSLAPWLARRRCRHRTAKFIAGINRKEQQLTRRRGHNEGSISARRNDDGSITGYQVQVTLPNGRRKTLGTVKTMREAKQLAQRGQSDINVGHWSDTPRQSVATYLHSWMEVKKANVRYSTVVSYQRCIKLVVPHIGHIGLDSLTTAHVQHCYRALTDEGQGARSVELTHRVLHAAFQDALHLDPMSRNPTDVAGPPRPARREAPALTVEQLQDLLNTTAGQMHALIALLAIAGLRIGEALGIT